MLKSLVLFVSMCFFLMNCTEEINPITTVSSNDTIYVPIHVTDTLTTTDTITNNIIDTVIVTNIIIDTMIIVEQTIVLKEMVCGAWSRYEDTLSINEDGTYTISGQLNASGTWLFTRSELILNGCAPNRFIYELMVDGQNTQLQFMNKAGTIRILLNKE